MSLSALQIRLTVDYPRLILLFGLFGGENRSECIIILICSSSLRCSLNQKQLLVLGFLKEISIVVKKFLVALCRL